jgi:hypothetical protein
MAIVFLCEAKRQGSSLRSAPLGFGLDAWLRTEEATTIAGRPLSDLIAARYDVLLPIRQKTQQAYSESRGSRIVGDNADT